VFDSLEILLQDNAIPNIKEEDWEWMTAINLKGTVLCTQAFFQHMCD